MRAIVLLAALLLSACASTGDPASDPRTGTDLDRVAETHRREAFASLKLLAEKLYRRNPREWRKSGHASMEAAITHLFDPRLTWVPTLEGKRGVEAIAACFRDDFQGDRVAALIGGMGGMVNSAFNGQAGTYVLDDLDPQKLYNSARNIEIAAWKLANARDAAGNLLLLSNEMQPAQNLSFEREFGKLIGNLDLLSRIIADKTRRTVSREAASAAFLPVPIPQ
ncbi:MAG: hypothetical protein HZC22_00360 [Rhodocyclales bacterium]|nr:hypothetical protein [Rhodocyclales bacterium]